MLLENNPFPQDVRVYNEARSLTEAGYRVTVIAPREKGQARHELVDGVEARRFRLPMSDGGALALVGEFAIASSMLILGALRALARGADVLHLHNPPDTLFPAGAIARLLGRRVVFDHHDLTPELVEARAGAAWAALVARWCERQTFRAASLVLSSNESYAGIARARGDKRAKEVAVVRNGPKAATLSSGAEIRAGALNDPHLVYVGAVAPQDDVEDLPEVLATLRDAHGIPEPRLTIVGAGPSCDAVLEKAARLGVADRIEITGWIDSREVPRIVREADICVDPAHPTPLNDHSTMIKIAEYLAAGRPVVAYDLTETQRTAAGAASLAGAGDPQRFAESVAALARDEQARHAAAEKARLRAPNLTWERSEVALVGAYDALCAGIRRPAPSAST